MPDGMTRSHKKWRIQMDFFAHESRWLERDIEILVLDAMNAGVQAVNGRLERTRARLKEDDQGATEQEKNWAIDYFVDIRDEHDQQVRFLRNMAAVALLSRLAHALNKLAKDGDTFAPRDPPGYGRAHENEFRKLWLEFDQRFGVTAPSQHVKWLKPLIAARIHIVHNGGEAVKAKPSDQVTEATPFTDHWDHRFLDQFPDFVDGEGFTAKVRVTEDQLTEAATKAVELVKWVAGALREKQLAQEPRDPVVLD